MIRWLLNVPILSAKLDAIKVDIVVWGREPFIKNPCTVDKNASPILHCLFRV